MIERLTIDRLSRVEIVAVASAALLALGAVLSYPHSSRGAPPSVVVIAREFLFDPKGITVGTGAVTFVVKNQGEIDHNFVLEAPGGETLAQITYIEPGQMKTVTATLSAGNYTIYCSLPGHREAGMVATIRVTP